MKHEVEQFPLLHVPEIKSPRAQWIEKYGVIIQHWRQDGKVLYRAFAHTSITALYEAASSEQEAIKNLATANGWKLWNEEV
jgi:hypothetical protein